MRTHLTMLSVAALHLFVSGVNAQLLHSFDGGSMSWTIRAVDVAENSCIYRPEGVVNTVATWSPTGGSPAGALRFVECASCNWSELFSAPPDMIAAVAAGEGGMVSFDWRAEGAADHTSLRLRSPSRCAIARVSTPQATQWGRYSFRLTASTFTDTATGLPLTEPQFAAVLSSLDGIGIRADWGTGFNHAWLDNVEFDPCPAVVQQPQSAAACPGGERTFTVAAAGVPLLAFQWQWRPRGFGEWIDVVEGSNEGQSDQGLMVSFVATDPRSSTISMAHAAGGVGAAYSHWDVRCVVANTCGEEPSDGVVFFIDPADTGSAGGESGRDSLHDNNDFIAFINYFFSMDPSADVGQPGGLLGSDGVFDNNDFISFINLFFEDC